MIGSGSLFQLIVVFCLGLSVAAAGCTSEDGRDATTNSSVTEESPNGLPDDQAGEIVRRAIERAGGWSTWVGARSLDYRKTVVNVDESGEEWRRLEQRHHYILRPEPRMRIEFVDEEGRDVLVVNDGDEAWKWIDGERATSEEHRNNAWNSTFGSHYVMSMPFKLADPGTILSYEGRDTLDGVPVDAVRVEYEEGAGSSGGMHTWTYFFAVNDARLVANHLRYGPAEEDNDFTEYHDLREVGGITLPMRRVGYRSNPERQRLRKTSMYLNEDVRVNAPMPDSLFELRDGS